MYIQIDGTNTQNKGAELMLNAVLDAIVGHIDPCQILYNPNSPGPAFRYKGDFPFKERKILNYSRYPEAILRRLKLPRAFFTSKYASSRVDVVLDAGGFHFSDQWGYPGHYIKLLDDYYKGLHKNGTKLIFLPQAFGPFKTKNARRSLDTINKYADLIIARDKISYDHIIAAGAQRKKVKIYPDFTLKIEAGLPQHLSHLHNKVCLIPNSKMITHTQQTAQNYLNFMYGLIETIEEKGHEVFLLNHEGAGDLRLCEQINQFFDHKLELITGLEAREIKGVIGSAHLVISSRFHGVASALSQGVPCLSTSWNHKYEMLYKDYDLKDMVLDLNQDFETLSAKVNTLLEAPENKVVRNHLQKQKLRLHRQTDQMWEEVFEIIKN